MFLPMIATTPEAMMNGARKFIRLDSQTVPHTESVATKLGGTVILHIGSAWQSDRSERPTTGLAMP